MPLLRCLQSKRISLLVGTKKIMAFLIHFFFKIRLMYKLNSFKSKIYLVQNSCPDIGLQLQSNDGHATLIKEWKRTTVLSSNKSTKMIKYLTWEWNFGRFHQRAVTITVMEKIAKQIFKMSMCCFILIISLLTSIVDNTHTHRNALQALSNNKCTIKAHLKLDSAIFTMWLEI